MPDCPNLKGLRSHYVEMQYGITHIDARVVIVHEQH